MSPKCLIIGGGTAGCAAARALNDFGFRSTLIEAGNELGAGVRTRFYGGHPYTFGPRHFFTTEQHVYEYLHSIVPLRSCNEHIFLSYVERDEQFYNFPIHVDDIQRMPDAGKIEKEIANRPPLEPNDKFEDFWIKSVGETLYKKLVDGYTRKMWQLDHCNEFDTFNWSAKGVALKTGGKAPFDDRISAYPIAIDGYNKFFDEVVDFCDVKLGAKIERVDFDRSSVFMADGSSLEYDYLINTISPDVLMQFAHGELPYLGRDIMKIVLPVEYAFPEDVYFLYYTNNEPFTRIVEYKKFTRYKSDQTLLGLEIPSLNGRHYPLPKKSMMKLANRYHSDMPENVFSIGRAGTYRYSVDIDDCIEQGLLVAQMIKAGASDGHPVPDIKWRSIG